MMHEMTLFYDDRNGWWVAEFRVQRTFGSPYSENVNALQGFGESPEEAIKDLVDDCKDARRN